MTAKRKRMTREERRQSVLRAAARVFAEKGYRLTSIDDIVEAAGVSRGLFYMHFDSKKEAFLELIEAYFAEFAGILKKNHLQLDKVISENGNILEAWRGNLLRILSFHNDNSNLTRIIYREALGRDEDFSERIDELSGLAHKLYSEEFRLMASKGLIRLEDVDLVTSINLGATIYVIMEHLLEKNNVDIEEIADRLLEYHTRALVYPGFDVEAILKDTLDKPTRKKKRR